MPFKKRANQEAQPILAGRKNNTLGEANLDQLYAVAGLIVTTLSKGNAVYLTPGRFGGLQYKVYVEGDQFAEYVEIGAGVDDLVEQLLDALYDKETVAWYRNRFGARRAESGSEPSPAPVKGSSKG